MSPDSFQSVKRWTLCSFSVLAILVAATLLGFHPPQQIMLIAGLALFLLWPTVLRL
jgi:hypothetical protein